MKKIPKNKQASEGAERRQGASLLLAGIVRSALRKARYHIQKAFVVSNERTVSTKGKIIYIPVYYIMFSQNGLEDSEAMQF